MSLSRRRFLQQTIGFSAMAALGGDRMAALAAATAAETPSPAAAPVSQALHLLAIGDFGVKTKDLARQRAVSDAMAKFIRANDLKPDALALLGDNFYGGLSGKGVRSLRWQQNIEGMYPRDPFDCPMFAMLGNHDYNDEKGGGCVAAQLQYKSHHPDSRWLLPAKWYSMTMPAKDPLATIVVIDTMRFDKSSEAKAQLAWLKKELGRARTTKWLFVMGHHPLYSDGQHGDNKNLIAQLDPLLREHEVDLYLSGHDHDLQHVEFDRHPTSFVISGGGGARARDLTGGKERSRYAKAIYGFTHLELRDKSFTVRHINANNRMLHAFTKERGGKVQIGQA